MHSVQPLCVLRQRSTALHSSKRSTHRLDQSRSEWLDTFIYLPKGKGGLSSCGPPPLFFPRAIFARPSYTYTLHPPFFLASEPSRPFTAPVGMDGQAAPWDDFGCRYISELELISYYPCIMGLSSTEAETLFLVISLFVFAAAIAGYLIWKNAAYFGFGSSGCVSCCLLIRAITIVLILLCSFKLSEFTPPPARQAYLEAREKLDLSKPEDMDTLRKLLMTRAVQTMPVIRNLQEEGSSIDRLYRKGMLTDGLHSRVRMNELCVTVFESAQQ